MTFDPEYVFRNGSRIPFRYVEKWAKLGFQVQADPFCPDTTVTAVHYSLPKKLARWLGFRPTPTRIEREKVAYVLRMAEMTGNRDDRVLVLVSPRTYRELFGHDPE